MEYHQSFGSKKAASRRRLRRRTDIIHGEEEFQPRDMVPWFHPVEMARTAVRVLLANVVTTYSDSRLAMTGEPAGAHSVERAFRELAAAEGWWSDYDGRPDPTHDVIDFSDEKEGIWFDYVADTGEGFDSTYSVANLLGRRQLDVSGLDEPLPRGRLLVLGGDMVYPWPSRDEYRDRFQVPFRWALPGRDSEGGRSEPEGKGRALAAMVAIPGNHDWYDGLNAFLGVFCDGRRIGGWDTVQRRSYFAVRLPHDWMLWGTDSHLNHRTDHNQRAYFRSLSMRAEEGSKVILCTPTPSWLEPWGEARRNIRYFEEEIARWPDGHAKPHELPVVLSGDLHFYARYEKEPREDDSEGRGIGESVRHRIICGGGGAYTRGTHDLPLSVSLWERTMTGGTRNSKDRRPDPPDAANRDRNRYTFAGPGYPDPTLSRSLARGALRFPILGHNLPYCLAFGLHLLAITGIVHWASLLALGGGGYLGLIRDFNGGVFASLRPLGAYLRELVFLAPAAAILPALTMITFMAFFLGSNPRGRRWTKWLVGVVWMAIAAFAFYAGLFYLLRLDLHLLLALLLYVLVGGFLAGALTGVGLWLVNRLWGWNSNEVFSCQSIPDFKSFLRCHIDEEGVLRIYPIGIERVPRRWRRRWTSTDRSPGSPEMPTDMEPVEDSLVAHLLEPPIVVPPTGRRL